MHYWASPLEGDLVANDDIALVGGGNSAGQAVVFLAGRARRVTLFCRRPLTDTMSQYLIDRIGGLPNVDVVSGAEIAAVEGADGALEAVVWRHRGSGSDTRLPVRHLFSFIGAEPNTDWLAASGLRLDPRGFLLTGDQAGDGRLPHETSHRGVFSAGDVRSASVKRVASAVGDGAQVVAAVHAYLADSRTTVTAAPVEPVPVTA